MVVPLLLAVALADWVPARWASTDPANLELVASTPINCLLLEPRDWSRTFAAAAGKRGIAVLGVVRPGADLSAAAAAAASAALDGIVLEGEFPEGTAARLRDSLKLVIELAPRTGMRLDGPIVGTDQGLWPGIRMEEQQASATSGPWIETNSGFLRYLRAATSAPVWIGVTPPPRTITKVQKYLHAVSDAAVAGARWIVALDDDFRNRLLAREPGAVRDWGTIGGLLRFYEEHREWQSWPPHGRLAVVEDTAGALYSGGILDMIAVKHTPIRPIPARSLTESRLKGATMAVNVDPEATGDAQKQVLQSFTKSGGTVLTAPPGWKLPPPAPGQVTLPKGEVAKIDEIWKGINSMIGRANLGVRLFNVSGMLSSLNASPDGKTVAVTLVNYTDYPVESVTAHVLGKFAKATLYAPGRPERELRAEPVEDATSIEIPEVGETAAIVLQ